MGRRPKPTAIKLVTGNPGRRHLPENEPKPTGRPIKPAFLKGRAAKIWKEYFERAFWLTEADSHMFAIWCELAYECEKHLEKLDAARITQFRLLGAELGLTPGSRAKLGTTKDKKKKTPAGEFFPT